MFYLRSVGNDEIAVARRRVSCYPRIHAILMRYSCDIHAILMRYSCDIHAVLLARGGFASSNNTVKGKGKEQYAVKLRQDFPSRAALAASRMRQYVTLMFFAVVHIYGCRLDCEKRSSFSVPRTASRSPSPPPACAGCRVRSFVRGKEPLLRTRELIVSRSVQKAPKRQLHSTLIAVSGST